MGEKLLQSHVRGIRARLETLPPTSARFQRVDLEDNIVEFKFLPDGDSEGAKRLNFLIYEADDYPKSGCVVMSDDDKDEALVDSINELLQGDNGATVADALRATCKATGVEDSLLLSCLEGNLAQAPSSSSAMPAEDAGLTFEGDEDEGQPSYAIYIGSVADRESRPGWRKLKWQEIEKARLARRDEQQRRGAEPGQKRRKGASGGQLTMEEQKAAGEQMWSSQEAFAILSNELYQLQTLETDANMILADAIEYDVHHWTVRLSGCAGALGVDLRELKARHGYDFVEVCLSFKEDLHPFYPPTASVIRPRLLGQVDVLAALACHPRLQLRGWSPFQTIKDMLFAIRRFLEKVARVDLASERNDQEAFACGAFLPLERQLAKLGSLCELAPLTLRPEHADNPYRDDPWACDAELTQSSLGALLQRKKEQEQQKAPGKGQTFWAAGTGYGSDNSPEGGGEWDPQAMRAVQLAQDEELQAVVRSITESLAAAETEARHVADLLSKSCLLPFLQRELSTSYTSMGDRLPFFREIYQLVQEVLRAIPDHAVVVLSPGPRQGLHSAKASAKTFRQSLGASAERDDLQEDVAFADVVIRVADEVERLLGPTNAPARPACMTLHRPVEATLVDVEAKYCERMRPLQLDQAVLGAVHSFHSMAVAETVTPQPRTVRIAKELAGLGSLLPLNSSSSVFVRVDCERQQVWRALITGPDDTPYSNGCFIFDIYFPSSYPMEPPKVKFLTTGNNSVNFNPNLYESGKVCLSLLGTWRGHKGESWEATTSRVVQVLVSIQSLILVPDPYFNEPGFEREIGTRVGEERSREYSINVKEASVKWAMMEQLKKPPPEFKEVIHEHFRMRASNCRATLQSWIEEAEKHGKVSHKTSLERLQREFETELAKILVPGVAAAPAHAAEFLSTIPAAASSAASAAPPSATPSAETAQTEEGVEFESD